jgi:hypothetical protein
MGAAVQIRAGIPAHDAATFAALPDGVKWDVLDLLDTCREASRAPRPRAYLAEVAARKGHLRGWSFKSLERKFYRLLDTRDWKELIDGAKTPGNGKSEFITPAVAEAWKGYCDRHPRSYKSAWIEMAADYRSGAMVGDVDWRRFWAADDRLKDQPMPSRCPPGMPLPDGWSYHNLMRHQPKQIEQDAARLGRHAARKLAPRVLTTRSELPVGAQYEFDDMWHNCVVVYPGQAKAVRPLELACLDISSGHKVAFGLKPRTEDADGKRRNLTEADMRFLVAHVLINVGFHRDGCLLLAEGGTAAIKERLKKVLHEVSGGLIRVSTSGVDRVVPLGKWGYDPKGNPDHKSHLESHHNLAQNRLDNLPGYLGSNSRLDKPEDSDALVKVVDKMLAAQVVLPPELARKLVFPVLDWQTFSAVVHEVYAQIGASNDHRLEGWQGRTERQWKAHPADLWHSERDFEFLPQEARNALAPILQQPGMTRVAPLSRRQVWEAGQADLVRLPDWTVTLICGQDLAKPRPCPECAEIVFEDAESGGELVYKLDRCVGVDGAPVALKEGEPYLWLVNPFDPRAVFVTDTWGRYVGRCPRYDRIDRADLAAIGLQVGHARKALDAALAPLARRGREAARNQLSAMERNAETLGAGRAALDAGAAAEKAVSEERRDATRGVSLSDLADSISVDADIAEGAAATIDDLM